MLPGGESRAEVSNKERLGCPEINKQGMCRQRSASFLWNTEGLAAWGGSTQPAHVQTLGMRLQEKRLLRVTNLEITPQLGLGKPVPVYPLLTRTRPADMSDLPQDHDHLLNE